MGVQDPYNCPQPINITKEERMLSATPTSRWIYMMEFENYSPGSRS